VDSVLIKTIVTPSPTAQFLQDSVVRKDLTGMKLRFGHFLRTSEFSQDRANEWFPHARDIMLGGLFISHSGEDSIRIEEQIISPVVSRTRTAL
jgi:hypothetical protein